jgi:hypothetical protein
MTFSRCLLDILEEAARRIFKRVFKERSQVLGRVLTPPDLEASQSTFVKGLILQSVSTYLVKPLKYLLG